VAKAVTSSPEDANLNKLLVNAGKSVGETLVKLTQATKGIIPKETDVSRKTSTEVEERAEKELNLISEAIDKCRSDLDGASQAAKSRAEQLGLSEEEHGVTEAIIEASQAIVKSTAILVNAASNVQSDFVALIKEPKTAAVYQRDPQYAENLMTVGRTVLSSVQSLVKAANNAAIGATSADDLIEAAQKVASTTTDLVTASTVKGDPNSPSQGKLKDAASRVALATHGLVAAAKNAAVVLEAKAQVQETEKYQLSENKLLEMKKQMEILKMQKELEKLKRKQQATMKNSPSNPSTPAQSNPPTQSTPAWNTNPVSGQDVSKGLSPTPVRRPPQKTNINIPPKPSRPMPAPGSTSVPARGPTPVRRGP